MLKPLTNSVYCGKFSARLLTALLLLSGLSLTGSPAFAEGTTIATIDINKVINELKEAKTKKAEIEKKSQEAKNKIDKQKASLQATEKTLKEKKVSPDSKEVEDFRSKVRDFEQLVRNTEEDLKREFMLVNKTLTDKVLKLVGTYSEKHGIELVLDKGANTHGPLLYGDESMDITADIVKELND